MKMKKWTFLLLLFGFPLIASLLEAGDASFKVIVNASNPVSAMTRGQLSNLFLKKATIWENGRKALPVDQVEASAARTSFSEVVLKKETHAVVSYWQHQIFSGRGVPPPEKPSDREVVAYVQENPNAIGYVSEGASLPDGVREVRVTD
jgi:ABC-type phosphate transport system substrate-binding protein